MRWLLAIVVAAALGHAAHAYPQYQLSRDATCTGCHLSPAGGGLLDENGLAVAESTSSGSGAAAFLHGALEPPSWLALGGDVRLAGGAVGNGKLGGAAYPMQAEVYASAAAGGLSLEVTGGLRRPADGASAAHVAWSREHYVMWRQHPSSPYGAYVRLGRFMPVFGLRLAEHIAYTQRYGGYPLYGEAYGAAVEYVDAAFEVHATGFVHDSIGSAVEHGDGAAVYAEARLGKHAAVGGEAKYAASAELHTTYAGLTGKLYVEGADLLVQGEAEVIRQTIVAGGATTQLAGYVLATRPITDGWLLDVGLGHYTQATSVAGLYRDCVDANVHWFATPHTELMVTTRLELLDHGAGPTGGYALLQVHYRL
jgi:hypothetical protein